MGVTYKAVDVHLQRPVALKIINVRLIGDASARHRFVREARAAASVRHPHVASVFHLGESGGKYFYAMEFVAGETLEKVIRRSGRLKTDVALEVVAQIAAGLTAIQKQHLVHRDIKPSNIMISFEDDRIETVKIIDLGLAKGIAEESISTVGSFTGTPEYASPEQFAGVRTDIRSDLYSLGITLWEMLSGKLPFQGSVVDLMYQHQHSALPVQKIESTPAPVIALLQILLAKDPGERFQDPAGLQKALTKLKEAIASGSHLAANDLRTVEDQSAEQSPERVPKELTTPWWLAAAFGLAALLVGPFFILRYQGLFLTHQNTQAGSIEKSIAVLPFENISPNKDDAYFTDGVQDEILNNLAKIAQLKVISRTSVMQYRADSKRDLRQIAAALGVANVLEGTVRRDGNHVRVSTELVDARTDNTIWADSYDRDLTNIFAIQSEIAQEVASRLSAQLSPEERKDIVERPTENLQAYDLYFQAKGLITNANLFYLKDPHENLQNAINFLEKATREDPRFTLAYCLLAKAHDYLYEGGLDRTPERRALGDAAVDEALRLRPDLPEVHLAAAYHRYACYRDYDGARIQIAIAQRSLPNNPDALALLADLDRRQSRWVESTAVLEKAVTLDPRNPEFLSQLADNYFDLRRYRNYEHTYDRLIELEPNKPLLFLQKAFSGLNGKADLTSYRAALETLPSSMKDDLIVVSSRFAYALADRDWATAKEILGTSTNAELYYFNADTAVPRGCLEIWLAYVQNGHATIEAGFLTGREELNRKVTAHAEDASLLSALAVIDSALGRRQEAIEEAKRAVAMLPVSKDAVEGPSLVYNLAAVYAATGEPTLAFAELSTSIQTPGGATYGTLKLDPAWDPIRNNPRFEKLLAELAPRD
jgi:serine/threonine-protein kinase